MALVAVSLLALGVSGCGASDEEQIRDAVADLSRAIDKKDAGRACEVLSFRAEAQYAAFASIFSALTTCEEVMKAFEPDDEQALTPKAIEKAKVTIRDDLALLRGLKDESPVGLRRVDGDWRVDNILNPSLREEVRGDPRLTRGTHEQQIRATMLATTDAFARKDHARVCRLMSYRAEAQLYLAAAFGSLAVADADASSFSCPKALRLLESLVGEGERDGGFASELPSRAELRAARISIQGSRATVQTAEGKNELVRFNGRWLLDGEPTERTTPAEYRACWRDAGAKIATSAKDLRFADETRVTNVASNTTHASVKGANWRIFYTLEKDGDDPGLDAVLSDPRAIGAVAYVRNARHHADVVKKARDCGE